MKKPNKRKQMKKPNKSKTKKSVLFVKKGSMDAVNLSKAKKHFYVIATNTHPQDLVVV
jgi:hypothetical protein